jgi:hypothetical protein
VLATLTPGVYAGYAAVLRPEGAPWPGESVTDWYRAAVNVGYVPSFDNRELSIEAHLLHEFSEDFYGAQMHLVLLAYLRPERKFVAIDALVAQIKHDIASTKRVLEELPFVPSACMFEWIVTKLQVSVAADDHVDAAAAVVAIVAVVVVVFLLKAAGARCVSSCSHAKRARLCTARKL